MLKNLITKFKGVIPFIALGLALDNRRLALDAKDDRLNRSIQTAEKLANVIKENQDKVIENQIVKNKIASLSADASDHLDWSKYHNRIVNELIEKLNNPNIDISEHEHLLKLIKTNTEQKTVFLEKANNSLQQINDLLTSGNSKNDFMSQFNIWIVKYKNFLSTLTVEQINYIINIIGYVIIISSLISIAAVLYGDFLIKYFKLEEKFPKIAKYIIIRRKFQWYYLNYNFIVILILSIFLIILNIENLFI
jgi:hypothetical protein